MNGTNQERKETEEKNNNGETEREESEAGDVQAVPEKEPGISEEEMDLSTAEMLKKATMDLEVEIRKINAATSRENGGKLSIRREDQRTVRDATDRIRMTMQKVLLEVIRLHEHPPRAAATEKARTPEATPNKEMEEEKKRKEREREEKEKEQRTRQQEENKQKKTEQRKKQEPERRQKGGNGAEARKEEGEWKTVSYAAKLKAKIPPKEETIVKMAGKEAEEVKKTLTKKLRVEDIGGSLSRIAARKDGSLVLVSATAESRRKLEEQLKKQEGVQIQEIKRLNPTLTLTGLEKGWNSEELVEEIR